MVAIHLVLLVMEEYFELASTDDMVMCDDKSMLFTFAKETKWTQYGSSNVNVPLVL